MLVVDSSLWIDFFAGQPNPRRADLRQLLDAGETRIVVPDLVLYEVLRGFRSERDLQLARRLFNTLSVESTVDPFLALKAAQHYRALRQRGVTVRSALDVLIATFCIEHDYLLLHNDRDFDAFEADCGLRVWRH